MTAFETWPKIAEVQANIGDHSIPLFLSFIYKTYIQCSRSQYLFKFIFLPYLGKDLCKEKKGMGSCFYNSIQFELHQYCESSFKSLEGTFCNNS